MLHEPEEYRLFSLWMVVFMAIGRLQAGLPGSEDCGLYDSRLAPHLRGMAGKRWRSVGGCSGPARTLDSRDD